MALDFAPPDGRTTEQRLRDELGLARAAEADAKAQAHRARLEAIEYAGRLASLESAVQVWLDEAETEASHRRRFFANWRKADLRGRTPGRQLSLLDATAPTAAPGPTPATAPWIPETVRAQPTTEARAAEVLQQMWLRVADDVDAGSALTEVADALHQVGVLDADARDLWALRATQCPGHDGAGRRWCAVCGDIPGAVDAEDGAA